MSMSHTRNKSSVSVPTKRSKSGHAARDAAALAEWSAKKWVWVPHETEGYVPGWVVKEEDDMVTVALQSGEILPPSPNLDFLRVNPPIYDGAEEIADLTFLNEASVVHNLKHRYIEDSIYTYSGLFLVAINPYKSLPIYSSRTVESYKNKRRDENPPHVYAVAEKAWQMMLTNRDQSQSILVTGESGAGKTENTKKVIQYLAAIAADPLAPSTSLDKLASHAGQLHRQATLGKKDSLTATGKKLGQLERQILEANPILESFGNAQTVKNNNSSRFGKFVRIYFNPIGAIAGANIDWYLLEKSRVTARSEHERAFHVFFQLLRGADARLKKSLLLDGSSKDYEYLKHSRQDVDGMDDRLEWDNLISALDTVGFSQEEQLDLFKVIAAILHLGNVSVGGTETAHIRDPSQLERICHLLGIQDSSDLLNALVRPKVKAGREWVVQARTSKQVVDELAALSKALYEKNFGAMVERINTALGRPSTKTFIGVLDIAGFEIFETNGFEQLCINLTNEKLQQFFNHHMFVLEQEEYSREEIEWEFRNFGLELQPTIDLIESNNPMGILSCLDDAAIMPKASDQTFTAKLAQLAKQSPSEPQYSKFTAARFEQGFTVSHYAGNVEYRTDGWLDKNRDPLSDALTSLLSCSGSPHIASMFAEYAEVPESASGPRTRTRRGAFRTVGQRHKDQLAFLMSQLRETQPHFVRCIVPNLTKTPGIIDTPLVLDQLRCNGVLEGIRIARLGYPNRLPFSEFRRRFELLAPKAVPKTFVDGGEACRKILDVLELEVGTYQLGLTKVFFKAGILAELEERRDDLLSDIITRVQATCRKYMARRQANKIINRAAAVRLIQRNAQIYGELRAWPWWPLFQKVRPMLAAARDDEEQRRKEQELADAKERAEREEKERERLQAVQLELEATQVKMEEVLASERARLGEKDAQLMQSKKREAELEEDLAMAKQDLDLQDEHLERALAAKAHFEKRISDLDSAVGHSNALVKTLQDEQAAWKAKEAQLATQTSVKTAEWQAILAEKDASKAAVTKLQQDVADSKREQQRLVSTISSLEARLDKEVKETAEARKRFLSLETDARTTKDEVAKLERDKRDLLTRMTSKESELVMIRKEVTALTQQRDLATASIRELEAKLASTTSTVSSQSRQLEDMQATRQKLEGDVASLKKLLEEKISDHERQSQVNQIKETEVQSLRLQISKAGAELATAQRNAADESTRLRQDVEKSRRNVSDLTTRNSELSRKSTADQKRIGDLEEKVHQLERLQQAHDLELELSRTRAAEETLLERSKWEKERSEMRVLLQRYEDSALAAERSAQTLQKEKEATLILLEAEQGTVRARDGTIKALNQKIEQQHVVLADYDKINSEMRADMRDLQKKLKLAEDKGGKMVIEHIRVLEEAQRLQNLEMERMRVESRSREARFETLQKANTKLNATLEDMQHEREAEKRAKWLNNKPVKDVTAAQLRQDLETERKTRQEAELNVQRLRSDVNRLQSQLDTTTKENRDLQKSKQVLERELNTIAASDHHEPVPLPRERRMMESRAANVPSPTRTTFGAVKPLVSSYSIANLGQVGSVAPSYPYRHQSSPPPATPASPSSGGPPAPSMRRRGYE